MLFKAIWYHFFCHCQRLPKWLLDNVYTHFPDKRFAGKAYASLCLSSYSWEKQLQYQFRGVSLVGGRSNLIIYSRIWYQCVLACLFRDLSLPATLLDEPLFIARFIGITTECGFLCLVDAYASKSIEFPYDIMCQLWRKCRVNYQVTLKF